ncbi:PIG-L deacetylase family protein [Cryptosporangium phraense]|uniref:PIG-L deacetylase family protein n=1 Tax=Cryptosporangium phraense TaxID=2593070 RepID=UPI00197A8C13|nr:PIG-L family deacetylase [Cryptosporangium phraense]
MEPLTIVDEGWQRALAIVAHPEDLELGSAAAIARWTGQGKDVVYTLLTSGEARIDARTRHPRGLRASRSSESRRESSECRRWSPSGCRTGDWSTAPRCGATPPG